MNELVIVGRGGEGVVVASQVLADTFARAGFHVQSFPEFKAERRGAPIAAFLRWDSAPIHRRFKVHDCDVLVDVSPSPPSEQALRTVRPGGLAVLNRESRLPLALPYRVWRVPASRIAREHGVLSAEGRPMGNTAVLGAAVKLLLPDGLPLLEQAILARMGAHAEANLVAAREGFARCVHQRPVASDPPLPQAANGHPGRQPVLFPTSTRTSLHVHTGSWSLDRPVLLERCNACAVCVLFCPEGAIARADGAMSIDYDYCKGCGICEAVCPVRGAIAMEEVPA